MQQRKNRLLWFAASVVLIGVAVAAPLGCGGSGSDATQTVADSGRAVGTLRLQVAWPQSKSRVIPSRSTEIRVAVTSIGGIFADGKKRKVFTITRPVETPTPSPTPFPSSTPPTPFPSASPSSYPPGTYNFDGIPAGDVSVEVTAYDAAEQPIARAASQIVRVQPGASQFFSANLIPINEVIPTLTGFAFTQDNFTPGGVAFAQVNLSGPAPFNGGVIKIACSDPRVYFQSAYFDYEQTEGLVPFYLYTDASDRTGTVTVTATYNGVTLSDTIDIAPGYGQ